MATPYAFVTLISSDSYLPGALALVAALRDLHPAPAIAPEVDFLTVCLVTPESVDVSCIKLLRRAFDVVIGVEIIEDLHHQGLELLGRPDLTTVLTKLHAFRLTQFSKIIFVDADILPIRPFSHLFTLNHEFSAVPDVGWPDIFNSGMMVFTPGEDKFHQLSDLLKAQGTWDGGDQGLLNEWRGNNWNRLSFTYNTTPTAAYTYAPAYKRFGSQISAIHFIGPNKPWKSIPYRPPGTKHARPTDPGAPQAYDYESLVDRWYDVYDRHYRSDLITLPEFEVQRYESVWNEPRISSPEIPSLHLQPASSKTFDLEELRRIAVEGLAQLSSTSVGRSGEGQYWSLPLDGRVDLMRPSVEPEPQDEPLVKSGVELEPDSPPDSSTSTITFNVPSLTLPGRSTLSQVLNIPLQITTLQTPLPHELPPAPDGAALSLPPMHMQVYPMPERPSQPSYHHSVHQQHHPDGHHNFQEQSNQFQWGQPSLLSEKHHQYGHSQQDDGRDLPSSHVPQAHREHYAYIRPEEHKGLSSLSHAPQSDREQHEYTHPEERRNSPEFHFQRSPRRIQYDSAQPHEHHHPDSRQYVAEVSSDQSPPNISRPPQTRRRPRPPSPPLLPWNPAVEPPPNTSPVPSAFPPDTYFPNIWDQAPSKLHDATHQWYFSDTTSNHSNSPEWRASAFFHPPPISEIPEHLIREGHYTNVTGPSDAKDEAPPVPDPTKVNPIFPWEERPRYMPGRVFPKSDAPPPGSFLKREKTPPPPEEPPVQSTVHLHSPSGLIGLPVSLNYINAWDTVPSIQSYASRLARPHQGFQYRTMLPFQTEEWKKHEKERFSPLKADEENSMDGDDEDDESDAKKVGKNSKQRSRAGSGSNTPQGNLFTYKGKKYRTRGVQTIPKETRSRAVQVNVGIGRGYPGSAPRSRISVLTNGLHPNGADGDQWTALSPAFPRATSIGTPSDSPSEYRSPRLLVSPRNYSPPKGMSPPFMASPPEARSPQKIGSPPRTMTISSVGLHLQTMPPSMKSLPPLARSISNDTALSSAGPTSPADGSPVIAPPRRPSRVFDPARGVDIIKKDSEEVLSRFLKMGSFDENANQQV